MDIHEIGLLRHPAFPAHAAEFFVKGGCHQLALALVTAIGTASFIAVYDSLSEDGQPLDSPRMVHAGASVGCSVWDIDGVMSRDAWVSAWADLCHAPFCLEWEAGELPFEFASAAHLEFAELVAAPLRDLSGRPPPSAAP